MVVKAKENRYDVVVVGAGNAALVAALSAHEAGAKVAVIEVAPKALRGGNTYFSGGGFRFPITGLDEMKQLCPDLTDETAQKMDVIPYFPKDFRATWMRLTEGLAASELVDRVVERSNSAIRWMADIGVKWEPYWQGMTRVGDRFKWLPGNVVVGAVGNGAGLSEMLFASVERHGIEILYETRAAKLIADRTGRVHGVTVKDSNGYRDIQCRGVVLGCGGFESNREWRCRYLGPRWEMARLRGTRFNFGAGIRMALEVGAQPAGHWSQCHGTIIDYDAPFFADRAQTDKSQRGSYHYSIMVNINGQRFVDEGEDIRHFTYAKFGQTVLAQPRARAFQLFDAKEANLLEARYSTGNAIAANTLDELADKLVIDKAAFKKTIAEFNSAVQEGKFDPATKDGKHTNGIDPPKSNWAQKLDTPPYLAYAVTGGITFTYGGVKIDPDGRVLDTEDNPIPGLYACGEIAGGLFFHNYPAGTGLLAGAVFGRSGGALAAREPAPKA